MGKLSEIIMRLLNTLTVFTVFVLSIAVLRIIYSLITGWGAVDLDEFVLTVGIILSSAVIIVFSANYIFFGKFALWHNKVSRD